ncbi:hypothetical protein O0L34_g5693 [Tuta absoluta]|nr:hypothetical protein O0L34_g5693 [Tuta absoluta]
MCDGLGRQFSYTCPNTTLFQQRMLICDHWYMVNCSMSERDYSANLLIGQRDKPFVSDEEMRFRTPRPDILSVPANSNYFNGLKEAESKYHPHPGNSIVGIGDSLSSANNNGLDSDKINYRPPTGWSTKKPANNQVVNNREEEEALTGAASQTPRPTLQTTPDKFTQNTGRPTVTPTPPSKYFQPPPAPTTETPSSEGFDIDIRMDNSSDEVVNFIRRFDPNSPDSIKTAMTKTEILNLNSHLPAGQSSAEDERTPRRNKNTGIEFNSVQNNNKKNFFEPSRFDTVNTKPAPSQATVATESRFNNVPTPVTDLLPPKDDSQTSSVGTTTTVGPPIYYEWKWAAPAFDLKPPKASNATNSTSTAQEKRNIAGNGRNPFVSVTRRPQPDDEPVAPTKNTEYNISSYFVPDYVFPLDNGHPSYEGPDAHTSFNVEIARPGRSSYGENPACPHCHPAYLNPGSCEPCIVKR